MCHFVLYLCAHADVYLYCIVDVCFVLYCIVDLEYTKTNSNQCFIYMTINY